VEIAQFLVLLCIALELLVLLAINARNGVIIEAANALTLDKPTPIDYDGYAH
jgi:hypothetical protein